MLKTFSITDVGVRRKVNQDYVYTCEKAIGNLPNLFLVADGMGGHKAGDYASRYTVEIMCEVVERTLEKEPEVILKKAIEAANEHIRGNLFKQSVAGGERGRQQIIYYRKNHPTDYQRSFFGRRDGENGRNG